MRRWLLLLWLLPASGCEVFIGDTGTEGYPCRPIGAVYPCDTGLECDDGLCVPILPCEKDEECPEDFYCAGERCVDCADTCVGLECGPNPEVRCDTSCGACTDGKTCEQGFCTAP